jgi:serine phosphatase RsbU (regulator of sigma subunit)
MHFTAVLVTIDLKANAMRYSVAGHPPPLLLSNGNFDLLERGKTTFGVAGAEFDEWKMPFGVGDALYLFTDGAVEARSVSGDAFGHSGLRGAILQARADDAPEAATVSKWIEDFVGQDRRATDDATFIGIRRTP